MKLKRIWKIILGLLAIFMILAIGVMIFYNCSLSSVDKGDKTDVILTIEPGTSTEKIAESLVDANLIRNKFVFLMYIKLNKVNNLQASTYRFNRSMSAKEIVNILSEGKGFNPDEIALTFKEGKNIRSIAKVISDSTSNKYDDVIKKVNEKEYINKLIKEYWFIDNDAKKSGLIYSLEGYLFPNTYIFENKDVTVEEIFSKMLKETDKVLSKYKKEIEKSDFSTQEILTLASVVELEGTKDKDRLNIASVFFNRLDKGISLGSDVTACYAQGIDDTTLCHNTADFNYQSGYNTRPVSNTGLPTGPICNPSESSIKAVLNAPDTNYLYFVADKNTNVYFFENYTQFELKIQELKQNGDWL